MQSWTLWENQSFQVTTPAKPHISGEEGVHLVVVPLQGNSENAWKDPDLTAKTFRLAAKVAGFLVEDLKIVQWANLQANGNWGLLPGNKPEFHVHVYGRKKTGKTWAQPVQIPKHPSELNNSPLSPGEVRVISECLRKNLG